MAALNATPGDISLIVGRALPGDTITLGQGTYTAFPQKAGVTYQAYDWAAGRAITGTTGYLGGGFGVRVTDPTEPEPAGHGPPWYPPRHPGSRHHQRRGPHRQQHHVEDHVLTARRTDGGRMIGYTFGSGAIRVSGIRFLRPRLNRVGKLNDQGDHALYMKNCTGCLIEDPILHDAGRFPIHFYPNADNNEVVRPVVWGSMGAVVFSGANDPARVLLPGRVRTTRSGTASSGTGRTHAGTSLNPSGTVSHPVRGTALWTRT
jgi:hypothetical protein